MATMTLDDGRVARMSAVETAERLRGQAYMYAAGRQDLARELDTDHERAALDCWTFAQHYYALAIDYATETTTYRPSIQGAYDDWTAEQLATV